MVAPLERLQRKCAHNRYLFSEITRNCGDNELTSYLHFSDFDPVIFSQ